MLPLMMEVADANTVNPRLTRRGLTSQKNMLGLGLLL